jgi:DNA-binding transcriptional MerR regulator
MDRRQAPTLTAGRARWYAARMERYRLAELAAATGVSARTIRYYIAEGLLPPPEGVGPAAVYTAAQRDRLALIATLKGRYLPLREIAQRLQELDDDGVRAALRGESAPPPALSPVGTTSVGERWERITLADGVELHVRTDRLDGTIPLAALVRAARGMLAEE